MSLEVTKQELLKQAIYLSKLYATTRNQDYKDQETRIRRIIVDLENFNGGGGTGGVTKIVAGSNVTISPTTGVGDVTINASAASVSVRTIDTYLATASQSTFTITAASFDFLDVYVNGARLIDSEYSISGSNIVLVSAAELDDEIIIISYYSTTLASLPKEYINRHDFVSPYSYCGKAIVGSLESQSVWTITRIQVLSDGSTTVTSATNVDWTNRLTHTYT
jgi:hypothetical protein